MHSGRYCPWFRVIRQRQASMPGVSRSDMQIAAIVIGLAITAVAIALVTRTVMNMRKVIMVGQPAAPSRYEGKADRWKNVALESLGHTRLLKWRLIGFLHL